MFPNILKWVSTYGVLASSLVAATPPNVDVLNKAASPGITYQVPKGTHPWNPVKATTKPRQNFQRLRGFRSAKTNGRSVAAILGAHQRQFGGFGYENITTTTAFGTQYAAETIWNLMLLLDTGSADTWVVQKDFTCTDFSGEIVPQITCAFGPAYPETFQYGPTTPEQHMFIQYGDGETVTGPMGFIDVTVGNITVKKQEVCLANSTYWWGNNLTSGLMGLAFPSLTNAYLGSSNDHDPSNQIEYSPLFTSMVSQGKVPPFFSIAIDRNSSGGLLAWGGVPPASGADFSKTATLDMIIVSL
jgi:Eukaryotic aspartyl protease